ncbi:chromosomal replication initiator protein DnaA [bacterium BMS3Bbin07]|nr:chromosomal replication initiator protein DnaA [bacterium BMS3Bbin07]HDH01841.1 chromosomal replication initiator protein DnaA [Nitrospirota bacterium]
METAAIWDKCLKSIDDKVGGSVFELWFKPIKLKQIKDDYVVVEIPNRFYKEWIEENYSEIIQNAFREQTGQELTVKYKIAEKQDKEVKKFDARIDSRRRALRNKGVFLNPKYTFEEFIAGPSNQFAHAAAMKVTEAPGRAYNPLFIYGGVGLGKTHLINAIGNRVIDSMPNFRVLYVPSEQFTNEVVAAIRHDKMGELKDKYRNVDLLLLDDVQFIANKTQTQEEFFHTFNALYEQQKQIVISSDRSPRDISDITDRLKSRFTMGLIADIQLPSVETKMAILFKKAEYQRIQIPQDVAYWLAMKIKSNIRELEGCLIKLAAHSTLTGVPITLDMAKDVLKDFLHDDERPLTVEIIQKAVADFYGIRFQELKTKKRTKEIALPRQIAMYISREHTDLSLNDIGKNFGGKDHSTVIYACRQIDKRKNADESFNRIIESLINKIKG